MLHVFSLMQTESTCLVMMACVSVRLDTQLSCYGSMCLYVRSPSLADCFCVCGYVMYSCVSNACIGQDNHALWMCLISLHSVFHIWLLRAPSRTTEHLISQQKCNLRRFLRWQVNDCLKRRLAPTMSHHGASWSIISITPAYNILPRRGGAACPLDTGVGCLIPRVRLYRVPGCPLERRGAFYRRRHH